MGLINISSDWTETERHTVALLLVEDLKKCLRDLVPQVSAADYRASLIKVVLSETPEQLETWRGEIRETLGVKL